MADYVYSIANDITGQAVNDSALTKEINDHSMTPTCDGCHTKGDVLTVIMSEALSGPDKTSLDGLVADHTATPLAPGDTTVWINGVEYKPSTIVAGAITWIAV